MIKKNSKGDRFHHGPGGTYKITNDPQTWVDEPEEPETREEMVIRYIKADLKEWNREKPVTLNSDLLTDLGYDYGSIAELMVKIEDETEYKFDIDQENSEEILEIETVQDLIDWIGD